MNPWRKPSVYLWRVTVTSKYGNARSRTFTSRKKAQKFITDNYSPDNSHIKWVMEMIEMKVIQTEFSS